MNKLLLPCVLLAVSAVTNGAMAAPSPTPKVPTNAVKPVIRATPDLSSPQATVRSFVAAINLADIDAMVACVQGAKPLQGTDGQRIRASLAHNWSPVKISLMQIKVNSKVKPVRLVANVKVLELGLTTVAPTSLTMVQAQKGWQIVPLTVAARDAVMRTQQQAGVLEPQNVLPMLASALSELTRDQKAAVVTIENSLRAICRSNLRQVAVAAFLLVQEQDEVFAFTSDDYLRKLKPYAQNGEGIFYDPKTKQLFGLNEHMENRPLATIKNPTKTVLFYTGKNGVLDFNYGGYALVAYADGHVNVVNRQKAQELIWTPEG